MMISDRLLKATIAIIPLLALPSPAASQERGPALFWGVSAITELPQEDVDDVSSWLSGEIGRTAGITVLDQDAVDEGFDAAVESGNCVQNDVPCVVAVARAIDAAEAVTGDLGTVGGVHILTIRRISTTSGSVIRQVTGQTDEGINVLVRSLPDMVATLYDIPHNQIGTIRDYRYESGLSYVIVTYGRPFSWLRPAYHLGSYPWWWAGPVRYHHHHHRWWAWHHRHPHKRPHHPHRPHHPGAHGNHGHHDGHHAGHHNGDRRSDGDGRKRDRDDRKSDGRDGSVRMNVPAGGPVSGQIETRPVRGVRSDARVDRPSPKDRSSRPAVKAPQPSGRNKAAQPAKGATNKSGRATKGAKPGRAVPPASLPRH